MMSWPERAGTATGALKFSVEKLRDIRRLLKAESVKMALITAEAAIEVLEEDKTLAEVIKL